MFKDVNLENALIREREIAREEGAMKFVYNVFDVLNDEVYTERDIRTRVEQSKSFSLVPAMKIALLEEERIFSIDEIRKICIKYRLRFLDSSLFKNELPYEAIMQIKELERTHGCSLQNFKIMAPSELFQLSDCDKDPLLFVQLDNGIYYLIHQWGKDISWYRKALVFPFRNLISLTLSILVVSIILSVLIPTSFVSGTVIGEQGLARLTFFLWSFVSIVAIVSYIGLAFFKNVSSGQWSSPFFKQTDSRT
jgi:hypothetical protein